MNLAVAELAGELREGLLALAVGTGMQVLAALMEEDVTAACGPKGRHDPQRRATRHGHERGSVTLGGRRVPVQRPRMRAADGCGELPVPTYELFSSTEVLGRLALERMLVGLSTRRYPVGLEPVGSRAEQTASSTSKSAKPEGRLYGAAEQSEAMRTEVREAYDEWMRVTTNWENEREYFYRLDKLDDQLASRGLERGDDLDEEVPLGTSLQMDRDDLGMER